MPKVVNLRRTKGRTPENAVRVDRRTKWGNPFKVTPSRPRHEAIEEYRRLLSDSRKLREDAKRELKGKDLACWCAPEPCHADLLIEVANESEEDDGQSIDEEAHG